MAKPTDFDLIKIKLASPERILEWSHGEITKPETINYRTQRAEKDGLFCEKIFGPEKDWECYCGKYKRIRYKGIVCDKCGVEVTRSIVRRERMGHIKLMVPVSHIWFLKGVPSKLGLFLNIPVQRLEKVIYYASYIITQVDNEARKEVIKTIEKEYRTKVKAIKVKAKKKELKTLKTKEILRLENLARLQVFSEVEYRELSLKYGEVFEAGIGAEAVQKIVEEIDLKKIQQELLKELAGTSPVNARKVLRRLSLVRGFIRENIRPEWMFLSVLPVIPPDLRPVVQLDGGRYATSDLNDLYRRVINRNNRLKHLEELNAPEVIKRNEKRMLQEAVDSLIDNSARKGQAVFASTGGRRLLKSLADMLKGKQGRFRQNLLGKRVDYSGRSVIVVGPDLKLDQCGIPKKMALELFKLFVIRGLIEKELVFNIRGAARLIEEGADEVWEILEEVTREKYVLLNRAPTLHRLGIQAFKPILIEGEAIQIHPLVCTAFNADFDGDQMAVHIPLSDAAQKEAGELMLSSKNILKPATGRPIVNPTKDIVLGCFYITQIKPGEKNNNNIFSDSGQAILAHDAGTLDFRERIDVRFPVSQIVSAGEAEPSKNKNGQTRAQNAYIKIETTVGRILFNEILPKDYPFQNEEMNSRNIESLVSDLFERYGAERIGPILDGIKTLGFEYATRSGVTWGMDDLKVPEGKQELLDVADKEVKIIEDQYERGLLTYDERKTRVIEVWYGVMREIAQRVPKTLDPEGSVYSIVSSGARGSWSQPTQMMGMKGLLSNPSGEVIELPVKSSYKEGFNVLEYFIATHGARKGTADTALRTATAGYLTRRLVDVAQELIISEVDCKDTEGFGLRRKDAEDIGQKFSSRLVGASALKDITIGNITVTKKGEVIDSKASAKIENSELAEVEVRSPVSCKNNRGLCQVCYGYDFAKNELIDMGEAIGVIAAQAIGEPGTQLTMRTFHTGGVAGGVDITQGLPRAEEIFEARSPKGEATLSDIHGIVTKIETRTDGQTVIEITETDDPEKNDNSGKKKNKRSSKETVKEYLIPPRIPIFVEEGAKVARGQQLSEGHIDLKELLKLSNRRTVEYYIINQILGIYISQGASIHPKHIEVIVHQMFSRVRVIDSGDTTLTPGEIETRPAFLAENRSLSSNKKKATSEDILLGISKVSLSTESFLAAASFQETARVLINAAISGKVDKLRGLKENVIIGRLIPVGTGFKKRE